MTPESFLNGKVILHSGDCLYRLRDLDSNSIDSCVTDPPYHLTNNTGSRSPNPGQYTPIGKPKEPKGGFMGKQWDGGDIAFQRDTWERVFRVLKPGAHLLAFGGTRTYHRLACAIEDAGFEIRDQVQWMFGQGFPKSLNVAIEFEQRLCKQIVRGGRKIWVYIADGADMARVPPFRDDDANEWAGFGTALKPAVEPICLARKPLSESTVAANVLKWGTGALNIDGCRVGTDGATKRSHQEAYGAEGRADQGGGQNWRTGHEIIELNQGRWPANVIHDGSEEATAGFPTDLKSGDLTGQPRTENNIYGSAASTLGTPRYHQGDSGSAARYFYSAKADSDDRLGSKHPTVKPLDLIEYLERLVTPPGGTILDPFAGTGTAGEAAFRQGFKAVLIEREPEYQADIRRRMALCMAGPDERKRESIKARTKDKPADHGPLFGGPNLAAAAESGSDIKVGLSK